MGFAEQFLQGLQAGRAEQERKRQLALDEEMRRQQMQFQRDQAEQQTRALANQDALQKLKLWESMPQPEQALPPGQAGPPEPVPVPQVTVPSLVRGGSPMSVTPTTMTDILTRNRAQEDLARSNKLQDLAAEKKLSAITITPEQAALSHGAFSAGQELSPQAATFTAGLIQADQAAKDRAAARTEAALRRGDTQQALQEQRNFQNGVKLRTNYDKEIKPLEEQLKLASEAHQLSGLDTGAADTSLIELAQRVFNPGAIVRDSTMKRFLENGNIFETAKAHIQQGLLSGGHLTPQMRTELLKALDAVAEGTKAQYAQKRAKHEGFAASAGLSPEETFGPDPFAGETGAAKSQGGVVEWGRDARGNPVPITR